MEGDEDINIIISDILADADRVIMTAISELNSLTSSANGNSRRLSEEELVEYVGESLRMIYTGKPHFRTRFAELVGNKLGNEIRQCLDSASSTSEETSVIESCLERLIGSNPYEDLKIILQDAIGRRASVHPFTGELTANSHDNICAEPGRWSLCSRDSMSSSIINDGCDTNSFASSYGAAYWETLNSDRLQELSRRLHPRHTWHDRLETLRTLASLPLAEIVSFPEWLSLRLELRKMLLEPEWEAFDYALRFHVKLLHSTSSQCVADSYVNLLEALHLLVESARFSGHRNLKCLDATAHKHLFQLAKLINAFQKTIHQYWSRFPDKHINTMIEYTVSYLLSATDEEENSGFHTFLSPLHVVALVDVEAEWFVAWTRSDHIRRKIIEAFEDHDKVLTTMTRNCLRAFESMQHQKTTATKSSCSSSDDDDDLGMVYSTAEVAYACLIHTLSLLGKLFCSSKGRALFGVLVEPQLSVTLGDFFASALKASFLLTDHVEDCDAAYCLSRLLVDLFRDVFANERSCRDCLRDERLLAVALDPVGCWLEGPRDKLFGVTGNDLHLLEHIADFLLALVDSCEGIQVVVERANVCKTILLFAEKLLHVHEEFLPSFCQKVEDIKTTTVKICCRLLSDHRAIVALDERIGFLKTVAEEWESRLRESEQQVASSCGEDRGTEWLSELTAVGHTPLGLLALHQANLLPDILIWKERELARDTVVKPLGDKSGMFLSQAAGMCVVFPRLTSSLTPIVNRVSGKLWSASELGCNADERGGVPRTEESLDFVTDQLLSNLVCILPSCQVVERLASSTAVLDASDTYFVKLLVSGIQDWCYRSERTCVTGLRLLSLLGTGQSTWLYLESNFHFQEMLLKAQTSTEAGHDDEAIIDAQSLFRTYLLVKMTEIGGEREKQLPPLNIVQDEDFSGWPIVTSLPIPTAYLLPLSPPSSPPRDIEFFLRESHREALDTEWLTYGREVFRSCLTDDDGIQLRGSWFGELLYLAVEALVRISTPLQDEQLEVGEAVPPSDQLALNQLACRLVVSYGLRLGLLRDAVVSAQDFVQMLNRRSKHKSFSWLTASVFLLMSGRVDVTETFVEHLQLLPPGRRLIVPVPHEAEECGHGGAWPVFCHNVEIILQGDLPLVANALRHSSMSVAQICQHWIGQCFWNVLDWEEICTYLGLSILMGSDFQVYFTVALFRHLQMEILKQTAHAHLPLFIWETRIEGFRTRDCLPFIDHLESKYRNALITTTRSGNGHLQSF